MFLVLLVQLVYLVHVYISQTYYSTAVPFTYLTNVLGTSQKLTKIIPIWALCVLQMSPFGNIVLALPYLQDVLWYLGCYTTVCLILLTYQCQTTIFSVEWCLVKPDWWGCFTVNKTGSSNKPCRTPHANIALGE